MTFPPIQQALTSHPIQQNRPLSTKEVFAKIKPLICRVLGNHSMGTGFFLNASGLILTAAHIQASTIQYQGKTYTVKKPSFPHYNPEQEKIFDLQLLQVHLENGESLPLEGVDFLELPQNPEPLEEGEQIYFGGHPITQPLTLHTGHVSSTLKQKNFYSFTVDGNVLPGNSGGPVVMQRDKLCLVGVIRSEISDIHPHFKKITSIFSTLMTAESKNFYLDNVEQTVIPIGMATNLHMAFSAISNNMATGIGNVVHAGHLRDLFKPSEQDAASTISVYEFLVVKKIREEDKKEYKGRSIYPDGHEGKHLPTANCKMTKRALVKSTERNPAIFYPEFKNGYNNFLYEAVTKWIDKGEPVEGIVDFSFPVGVDNGEETSSVQIYATITGGYHMRPIQVNTPKKETFEEKMNKIAQEIYSMIQELKNLPPYKNGKNGTYTEDYKKKKADLDAKISSVLEDYPDDARFVQLWIQFQELLNPQ